MNNRKHGFGREGWNGNIPLDSTSPLYANLFELVVGELEPILGQMGEEFDFGEAVVSLWLNHQSPPELDQAFEQLGSQLLSAKQGYAQMQEYDEHLFGEDFET